MSAEKTVFISYRRSVNWSFARLIFRDLREHGYDVFMDVESIDSGQFGTIILNQIAARVHFIVILTPEGVKRCVEPGDWLRREIERALDLERNIVPVLADNFDFIDAESYLTGKLSALGQYNGVPLSHDYFDAAMEKLRNRFLNQPFSVTIQPTPPSDRIEVQRRVSEVVRQPTPTLDNLTAEQYFDQGYECGEKGDYEGAIDRYTMAIRLDPKYALAYNNRGTARDGQGDHVGAITDYTESIFLNPQDAIAYYNRGSARDNQGDHVGAIIDYTESIRLDPEDADAYVGRGLASELLNDYRRALTDYDTALCIDPQHKKASDNRARLLKKMKK
jgi:tetratricopeptide (TPR) repeat protein